MLSSSKTLGFSLLARAPNGSRNETLTKEEKRKKNTSSSSLRFQRPFRLLKTTGTSWAWINRLYQGKENVIYFKGKVPSSKSDSTQWKPRNDKLWTRAFFFFPIITFFCIKELHFSENLRNRTLLALSFVAGVLSTRVDRVYQAIPFSIRFDSSGSTLNERIESRNRERDGETVC